MFFGKNLENWDLAMHECDCICFESLGPTLYQVDILDIFLGSGVSVWDEPSPGIVFLLLCKAAQDDGTAM